MVLSGKRLVFAELLSGNNFKPSLIYDTSIADFKNGQKIYKIKIQERQLLECLIIFQVMIVAIILRMMGTDKLLKSFEE